MEKFKPSEIIFSEEVMLVRKTHREDEEVWNSIQESRVFLRDYLFWVDRTESFSDVQNATDMFDHKWETDEEWCYSILSFPSEEFLGCISVHAIDFLSESAEIGYWLRLTETKKGIMQKAIRLLEQEIFGHGMNRLVIKCDVNNKNSSIVAKRCGYQLESTAKEAIYHYTGLHDLESYVKLNPKTHN